MRILVAYDGSRPAQEALEYAIRTYPRGELILLRVAEAADGSIEAGMDLIKEKLKALREETATELEKDLMDLIDETDVTFQMEMVAGKPSREIVSFAEEQDIDQIIVGSHGRKGASRILLGNVAEKVVRRAPVTVTVVR